MEFSGIACIIRVPSFVISAVAIFLLEPFDPFDGNSSARQFEIARLSQDLQRHMTSSTAVSVATAAEVYFGCLASCLRGVALYVVSGCSVSWAIVAAVVLGSLFYVVPWGLSF